MRLFGAVLIVFLALSSAQKAIAGEEEREAVAWCLAKTSTPEAFSFCLASALTEREIEKCISGGSCFGKNNEIRKTFEERLKIDFSDIRKYGICGGENSFMRKVFGGAGCKKIKRACKGHRSNILIRNNIRQPLYFRFHQTPCFNGTEERVGRSSKIFEALSDEKFVTIDILSPRYRRVMYTVDLHVGYDYEVRLNRRFGEPYFINITPRY